MMGINWNRAVVIEQVKGGFIVELPAEKLALANVDSVANKIKEFYEKEE